MRTTTRRLGADIAALLIGAGLLLASTPARSAPQSDFEAVRRGPVTILHVPADAGFARDVAGRALAHHDRIRRDLGLERQVAVTVLLLSPRVAAAEREAWKDRLPRWLAGLAVQSDAFIAVKVQPGQTPRELDPLLAHELTHVILKADYPGAASWPVWFQEGLAMHESGTEGLQQFGALGFASLRGRILPLRSLERRFPDNEAESRLAYAESYSFLSFLMGRIGTDRFALLMRALREEPFEQAFVRAYGAETSVLEREWLRWASRRYAWIPLLTGGTAFSALWVVLFFVALVMRRRKTRLLRERWAEEDPEEERDPLLH